MCHGSSSLFLSEALHHLRGSHDADAAVAGNEARNCPVVVQRFSEEVELAVVRQENEAWPL